MNKLEVVYQNDRPYGIRDENGFILFFPRINRYKNQEDRYDDEIKEQKELAETIVKYVKGTHNFLGENEIDGYEIYIGNKYLGFVTKNESASRSYWFIADTHDGSTGSQIKLKGRPYEFGPWKSWDDTRGGLVYATFPLELGEDPKWIDMNKYSWVT